MLATLGCLFIGEARHAQEVPVAQNYLFWICKLEPNGFPERRALWKRYQMCSPHRKACQIKQLSVFRGYQLQLLGISCNWWCSPHYLQQMSVQL